MPKCATLLFGVVLAACQSVRAQQWTGAQARELAAQAKLICADSAFADCDWSGVTADLTGKDLVLVGESDHGTKEVAELRNSLIAELQAKHGFDVVLFESGMGELILPEDASADDMANGLMGPWNTRSSVDLMSTVREEHMAYAGFDVQRNGRSFATVLRMVCEELKLDTALYHDLEARFTPVLKSLGPKADHAVVANDATALIADYDAIFGILGNALPEKPSHRQLLTHRTVRNRADQLRYMLQFTADKDWNARWAARDSAMSDNVRWLADTLYPGRKVIVIAHNYHIARSNQKERVMGEWLSAHYGERMLVIGTFTGGGSHADNTGKPKSMTAPDSTALDIKHVIAGLDGFADYLRIPSAGASVTHWSHGAVVVNDSFIDLSNSNTLVPAEHFDALLLIERSSPPVFLRP